MCSPSVSGCEWAGGRGKRGRVPSHLCLTFSWLMDHGMVGRKVRSERPRMQQLCRVRRVSLASPLRGEERSRGGARWNPMVNQMDRLMGT